MRTAKHLGIDGSALQATGVALMAIEDTWAVWKDKVCTGVEVGGRKTWMTPVVVPRGGEQRTHWCM